MLNPKRDQKWILSTSSGETSIWRVTFDDAIREGLYKRICLVKRHKCSAEDQKKFGDEIRAIFGDGTGEGLDVVPSRSRGQFMSRALMESCMTLTPAEDVVL